MYARTTYPPSEDSLSIPQNYRGIALHTEQTLPKAEDTPAAEPTAMQDEEYSEVSFHGRHPWEMPDPPPKSPQKDAPFSLGSLLGRFNLFFDNAHGGTRIPFYEKARCIGKSILDGNMENLLLIGLAVFLLLSDSGDMMCALILLALLIFT